MDHIEQKLRQQLKIPIVQKWKPRSRQAKYILGFLASGQLSEKSIDRIMSASPRKIRYLAGNEYVQEGKSWNLWKNEHPYFPGGSDEWHCDFCNTQKVLVSLYGPAGKLVTVCSGCVTELISLQLSHETWRSSFEFSRLHPEIWRYHDGRSMNKDAGVFKRIQQLSK